MRKYLPILKSKRGEFKALNALSNFHKENVIPCIELMNGSLDLTYDQLSKIWTFKNNEIILDSSYFYTDSSKGIEFITLLERLQDSNINVIPVIEINTPSQLKDLVVNYIKKFNSKLCIRVRGKYLSNPNSINDIHELIKKASITSSAVLLILDSENLTTFNLKSHVDAIEIFLKNINNPSQFNLITLAGGSFPENLSKIEADTVKMLPRIEWELWNTVYPKFKYSNLIYGDYGIKHPLIDPGTTPFEGTCSIKYTTQNHYAIFRGIRGSEHPAGGAQYHEKCKLVIAHPLYDGKLFSWADNEIDECSKRTKKPGNPESWVKIGHNRHFAKILSLL